ncbi:TPA: hypothetical protein ACGSTL_001185 [Vibrio parahaemolyticus]
MNKQALIAAQQAFIALKPFTEDDALHGTDEACEAESKAFELAEKSGIEIDERDFLGCTDTDRLNMMQERIKAALDSFK